ncbi:MAG: glucose-1-phosphate adenylyltransferase subunit GlgD [Oscillospiraceae bacterium]|nr:glucose-1-phosphate adenylyltransferase subunit GlgD [Oscillospiraceae bacterium]
MNVMGIIFANDATMGDLTSKRTMASLPFGGRYRQIDFHLSNMSAAGIRHIGIISRHNYQSLMNHVGDAEEWGLELGEGGLEFLTPYAMSTTDHYRGKLENLYNAMDFLEYGSDDEDEYVVMADSAILSNMDMTKIIAAHIESGKDITVVTKAGIANGEKQLDLAVKLDKKGDILDIAVDYVAPADYLASMDTFVLSKKYLKHQIRECVARNRYHMDRDLVMGLWQKGFATINIYQFDGIALFNESVEEYFRNSLALIDKEVRHDLFGGHHPVFTKVRDRVPSYYGENCEVENCLVADGCFLEGEAEDSVLFRQVTICEGAEVENCVIMNDTVVGEGATLEYVILDKNVTVRPGARLIGTKKSPIIIKRGETV